MQSETKISCISCGGSGRIVSAMNAFNPSGVGICAMCGGAGTVPVVLVDAGNFVDPRDAEIAHLKNLITQLQVDNTRLLEERRKVDTHYMVEHFHRVCDVPVLHEPQVPADERVRLRADLVMEESFELVEALYGPSVALSKMRNAVQDFIRAAPINARNIVDFADACADVKYVIVGSELEFGIDGRPIFKGVHEANMMKAGGPVRADGKRLKPEDWKPFDVADELRRQGWRS